MRFRVSKLMHAAVGDRQVEHFEAPSLWLDDELRADQLSADLVLTRVPDSVMVEGLIKCQVRVQCVRSLEMFDLPLSVALEDVFFALPHHILSENPGEDDPGHHITDDGYLDLTESVREHVIMAIPIDPISPPYRDAQHAKDNVSAILGEDADDWLTVNWSPKD